MTRDQNLQTFRESVRYVENLYEAGIPDIEGSGNVYMDGLLYIARLGESDWHLPIGNHEYISENLSELEELLFDFAEDEGYFEENPYEFGGREVGCNENPG